jgi:hypothetical protein
MSVQATQKSPWGVLKPIFDKMDIEELQDVLDYCNALIDERKAEKIEEMEAEIARIEKNIRLLKGY